MIIERIVIKSFGMLTDMTMDFSDSVNVIEGQNEAGKSTIAAFIKYMLYGFDAEGDDVGISERKKRINWNNGTAQGSMTVKIGEKRYLINRSTVQTEVSARVAYKEDCSIIDLETGAPAFGKSPAGEVFFGVDKNLFENTAFIGSLADTRIEGDTVKCAIENILFSGNEKINSTKALSKIEEKMETLYHTSGGGGAIIELMKKRQDLEEKLEKSNDDNRNILAKEAELHEIRERRAEAQRKRDQLLELDACYNNVCLIQTFDKLHELEKEAEAKSDAFDAFLEVNTKADFVPDDSYLIELRSARTDLEVATRTMTEAKNLYSENKNTVGVTAETENNIQKADVEGGEEKLFKVARVGRRRSVLGVIFTLMSLLLGFSAYVYQIGNGEILSLPFAFAGYVAAGVFGLLALVFICVFISGRKILHGLFRKFSVKNYFDLLGKIALIVNERRKRDDRQRDIEKSGEAFGDAETVYTQAKARLDEIIVRWGDEVPEDGYDEFLDELEERVRFFLEKKNALEGEKTLTEQTVAEIRKTLSDKSEIDIRAKVSPLKRKALSEINHDSIITGIADCKAEMEKQEALALDVENELSTLKTDVRDPGETYSKIRALDEKIDDLKRRHRAYYQALHTIESAQDALKSEVSPRLGAYATKMMEIMTSKKYSAFEVGGGLQVTFETASGEKKPVDFLSGGTQDLTYIAVRLALIDMLYTEFPPVTFDESFAHQDNTRSTAMMKAICHLSVEGHQSFIFTCRGRESALATEFDKGAGIFKLSVEDDRS